MDLVNNIVLGVSRESTSKYINERLYRSGNETLQKENWLS
jgi:hypothetical protein